MTVTVVICTLNGSDYLSDQLHSVLNQSRPPDEIVIRDDRSEDGTTGLISRFIEKASIPIRFEQNTDRHGVTRNFERAIEMASGDIVFLADQDDVWFPTKIERMVAPFEGNRRIGLVYSDAVITNSDLKPVGKTVFSTRRASQIWKGDAREALDVVVNPNVKGCTMAFRRSLVNFLLPIPYRVPGKLWGHDHWIAFVLMAISTVAAVDEPQMYYRIHGSNTSGNVHRLGLIETLGNSRRHPFRRRHRYSPRRVSERIQQYRGMLERLETALSSASSIPRPDKVREYIGIIHDEVDVLSVRLLVHSTSNPAERFAVACRLLVTGHYSMYRRGLRAFFKDLLRIG